MPASTTDLEDFVSHFNSIMKLRPPKLVTKKTGLVQGFFDLFKDESSISLNSSGFMARRSSPYTVENLHEFSIIINRFLINNGMADLQGPDLEAMVLAIWEILTQDFLA